MSIRDYVRKRSAELRETPIDKVPVSLAGMPSPGTAIPAVLASAALRTQIGDSGTPPHPKVAEEGGGGGRSGGGGSSGSTASAPPEDKKKEKSPDESNEGEDSKDKGDDTRTYTVRAGETLSGIAQKVYGRASEYRSLAKNNQLKNPNLIRVGQRIRLHSPRGFRR